MASKKTDHAHQTALQRKIFTRWINQKLIPAKRQPITDCVTDFADGTHLVDLLEVLSEKTSNLGLKPQDKRMQQIDNANRALKFVFESGVEMKLKPSAENLVDKDEGQVLALVWSIMLRFLKFGDDDDTEKLSAEDALLMWCRNQCAPVGLNIENFSKGFQDGLAFCAIMHKYRPKILDYASLDKSDVEGNLKKAFAAAEHCFGLEQYLLPSDIPLLDGKSMLVYVAEYYLGAAQMRKTDLAVRRVTKVINYTRINDGLRAEYSATAKPLRDRVDDALRRLREHVIDNTMGGARANLAAFEKYKQTEKGANIGDFLRIENVFNNLSRRLADHQRPAFGPGATLTPPELSQTLSDIEEAEKVKKKALHDELNRQIKLANIYARHTARAAKLKAWTDDKLAYINTKEAVDSSNAAKYHLNRLAAYKAEVENTRAHSWEGLKVQGAELVAEKFEHSAAVQASEAAISGALEAMDAAAVKKQATLDDDLARELYKEKTMLTHQQQDERFRGLDSWIKEKIAYTAKKEEINSVSDAQLQLSLLAAYESNKTDLAATSVPGYKALAQDLLESSYKSDLSSWEYPLKSEVSGRLAHIDNSWNTLATQSATKKAILEDDLARETYREEIRLANMEHIDRHAKIAVWVEQKEAYLAVREEIDTVDKAQVAIQGLESYNSENSDQTKTTVVSFKALGQKILTAEYKTSLSQWISPDRGAVTERHNFVDSKWDTLAQAAAAKKAFLDAELARELKKEELRLKIANLGGDFLLWSSKQLEDVEGAQFGFLLEEVEAYGAVMAASTAAIESGGTTKLVGFTAVFQEAVNTGVKDNRYSALTPNDLQESFAKLQAATAARQSAYDVELARQRANDALDHQFADLVDPFLKEIDANKHTISVSTSDLKEQLAFVTKCLGDQAQADKLPKVKELNDAITAAGFAVRYTTISALDVSIAWENYQTFLTGKAKALADEIQHRELRGVSPEEYAEIESQFKQFDKNSNGKLDAKEFKACLYSLGEEKPTKEVIEVMKKFGGDTNIGYDGFKEFMISTLGDVDTKPEIVEGLQLINRGQETAKFPLMNELFKDEDLQWFCKEAPKVGDDYDYNAFTEQVFAR